MDRPQMTPRPGERLMRYAGDRIRFSLKWRDQQSWPAKGFRALLRTNLGRVDLIRDEIAQSYIGRLPHAGAPWRDIPMKEGDGEWALELPLTEVGYFKAKAYAVDAEGRQFWPEGNDIGVTVHPDRYRTANTIYCAFTRMFGHTKSSALAKSEAVEAQLKEWDQRGYSVIPPSGKLRDLIQQLPHIIDVLGCRILHLLPVNPVPTTYARFGRYGSPYASQDLTAIDPALVEFDRRTTGIDQFRELTYAVHSKGARVFLDLVTNHTGWGSTLQENHPDWFLRDHSGIFVSPGAWGVTWEDLVEIDHRSPSPWDYLAEVFLTWCRRGVDGFRCDAGYKVPMPAWRYITARVRQEYPDTVFLLEGLGGSWEATETLLTDGGMQWAYSELFQNYSGEQVSHYLDYALAQSQRVGVYVHYSETHDNDRLAKGGKAWSLLRNRLCALTSVSGGFGFTCGVEWLAAEKINVHSSTGMSWGASENLMAELGRLNSLLLEHPCFFDGAKLTRLTPHNSPIYALRRDSEEGSDHVLALLNLDTEHSHEFTLSDALDREMGFPRTDLLGQNLPELQVRSQGDMIIPLKPGAAYCLASGTQPKGLSGDGYRRAKGCASWALWSLSQVFAVEDVPDYPWLQLAGIVEASPAAWLAALPSRAEQVNFATILERLNPGVSVFPRVVTWRLADVRKVTMVPPEHWLLVMDEAPFRATLDLKINPHRINVESVQVKDGYVACFPPRKAPTDGHLLLERYTSGSIRNVQAQVRYLPALPSLDLSTVTSADCKSSLELPIALLTNEIGGMARLCIDFGKIKSKYDCLLGANLHPSVPVDRHVFAKRARVWVNADGFISPLDLQNTVGFDAGPPARWRFIANAGDSRTVEIGLEAAMMRGRNTTVLRFSRTPQSPALGRDLPDQCSVRLTIRVDIEDRNFHWETKRNPGSDAHFSSHCRPLNEVPGFEFTPASDRHLRVFADSGKYHHDSEWAHNIPHPVEQSRGQEGAGDAYSPGWFEISIIKGGTVTLVLTADETMPAWNEVDASLVQPDVAASQEAKHARMLGGDFLGRQLARACHAFVVRRGGGKTVIAGYPWFLDWGRDSLICARGLIAAGLKNDVKDLLAVFGKFEEQGTLPNSIHGEDASNRDTTDAPLWYGIVCEDLNAEDASIYKTVVEKGGRTVADVLQSIAEGYLKGTSNGIKVDPSSALVWSPKHFTWMDTNYPAGTPRVGYPVEIQVLWIRLLRQLAQLNFSRRGESWEDLAARAEASFHRYFWLEKEGYLSDLLIADQGQPAEAATVDHALRSNYLFAVSLGLVQGQKAQRCIHAAQQFLVIPGALRSLAPLPASPPLPVFGNDGRLLNDPNNPYWGRYEGDEDTRRKPAYHNGTAWTWTFPSFCEAMARAWDFHPAAVAAAKSYLGSVDRLLAEGCLGHIPEIVDGDAPHHQRGCDAQAWGATEALRVWKLLNSD